MLAEIIQAAHLYFFFSVLQGVSAFRVRAAEAAGESGASSTLAGFFLLVGSTGLRGCQERHCKHGDQYHQQFFHRALLGLIFEAGRLLQLHQMEKVVHWLYAKMGVRAAKSEVRSQESERF